MEQRWLSRRVMFVFSPVMAAGISACGDKSASQTRFTLIGGEQEAAGKVIETKLTACGPAEGKPGTCEGTMLVQLPGAAAPLALQVTRDLALKKAGNSVFLPQLKGDQVTVTYRASKEGVNVATSVTVR